MFFQFVLTLCACSTSGRTAQTSPPRQSPTDSLLNVDRGYAAAAAKLDLVSGLTAMFDSTISIPIQGGRFANGIAEVAAELRAGSQPVASRVSWQPVGAGLSSDQRHGFTHGYMTVTLPDAKVILMKYLAYWEKSARGWKVIAYRRGVRAEGTVSLEMRAAVMATPTQPVNPNLTARKALAEGLAQVERDFSARAQQVGLQKAFEEFGTPRSINMGGQGNASFVFGSVNIGKLVSDGEPANGSSVSWSPDRTLVAASGDMGITFGTIRENTPAAGAAPRAFSYFTIWHRNRTTEPWRYIAE